MAMQPRTIIVSDACPPALRKRDVWRIEQFQLLKKVGSGYASSVYMATCRATGHNVAVKLYHRNKLSELNHFQVAREVKIHSRLDHKNIIALWAAFEDQYGIYLVSEFASKGDVFADVEKHGGQMTEAETVKQVVYPFLQALIYLHGRGIIHRDIKPENLLFTGAGILKVADFGLSIDCRAERPVTRVGTLDYMAPEVVVCPDKHKPADHKDRADLAYSDVVDAWAVGVLAYELIIGRPPFDKGHKKLTISEIVNGEPVIPAFVSEGATSFIRWALTKHPGKRPDVRQLAEHPWVLSFMKQPRRPDALRVMNRADSFIEPRSLGLGAGSSRQGSGDSGPDEMLQHLQLRNVAAGGKIGGMHISNSMTAADMMRWRDIAFAHGNAEESSDSYGLPPAGSAGPFAAKRKSDGHDESSSRRESFAMAGAPMPAALSRHNSGIPAGLPAVATPVGSPSHAAPGPAVYQSSDSYSPRAMSREEVFANLQASAVQLNRSNSFTSRLGNSSGGGGPAGPGRSAVMQRDVFKRSQSQNVRTGSASSPMRPSTLPVPGMSMPGSLPHSKAAGDHDGHSMQDLGRLRTNSELHGSRLNRSNTNTRPAPPQSPSARAAFAMSPSRLSSSFSTPNSPTGQGGAGAGAAPNSGGALPGSRLVQGSGRMQRDAPSPLHMPPLAGAHHEGLTSPKASLSPKAPHSPHSPHSPRGPQSPKPSPKGLMVHSPTSPIDRAPVRPDGHPDLEALAWSELDGGSKNGLAAGQGKGLFGSLKQILS